MAYYHDEHYYVALVQEVYQCSPYLIPKNRDEKVGGYVFIRPILIKIVQTVQEYYRQEVCSRSPRNFDYLSHQTALLLVPH